MPKNKNLAGYIAAKHSLTCHFCGAIAEHDATWNEAHSVEAAAVYFAAKGWREVDSSKYQVIAAACPSCAATRDSQR